MPEAELDFLLKHCDLQQRLNDSQLNDAESEQLKRIAAELMSSPRARRIQLAGPEGAPMRLAAQRLAGEVGAPIFQLNLRVLLDPRPDRFREDLSAALAAATEQSAALFVEGLAEWSQIVEVWRSAGLAERLESFPGSLFFADERAPERLKPGTLLCKFDRLDFEKRVAIWEQETPPERRDLARELAERYSFTAGQIENAALRARTEARLRGASPDEADYQDACNAESRHKLRELAIKIDLVFTWEDLILPETTLEHLRDLAVRATRRQKVYETWGFTRKLPYGRGVNALFYGESGTGKTMAAAVLARELGRELYRTEMSRIVSRYIGETEKNLARIFEEAKHSNAVLMFDEADALFAKRTEITDAHDRYANLETAYLLQEIERYSGLCILATNLPANMDSAFNRRIQLSINFPTPGPDVRLRLLESFIPPEAPLAADVDLRRIAQGAPLTGGGLKNIVLTAAFYAAGEDEPISMKYLLGAARLECAKDGKAFN